MADRPRPEPDLYGRRPTSESRGRTHERILAHQHAPDVVPGAEHALGRDATDDDPARAALAIRPAGSIAAALVAFHAVWVGPKRVTVRRAYERSIAFLVRDLDAASLRPGPLDPLDELTVERLATHLAWRMSHGLTDPGELGRCALHLARFAEWAVDDAVAKGSPAAGTIGANLAGARERLRAASAQHVAAAPPAFHSAKSADELRDTTGDAAAFGLA